MFSAKIKNKLIDFVLAILLGFSFVYTLTASLRLDFSKPYMLVMIFLILLIYTIIFYSHLSRIITAIAFGTGIVVVFAFVILSNSLSNVFTFLNRYFFWLYQYMLYADQPNSLYSFLTVISLCMLISLFVYFFAVRHFIFLVLISAGAAIFSIQWMLKYTATLIPFYLFVFIAVLYYLKYIFYKKSIRGTNDYIDHTSYLLLMIPLCIIVVFTVSVIQVSSKPLEWGWLDKKITYVANYFYDHMNYVTFDYFSTSYSGFSQKSGMLGGRVNLDKTPVLLVKSKKRVYLKGSSMDIYTGTRWKESNPDIMLPIYSRKNIKNNLLDSFASSYLFNEGISTAINFCTQENITVTFDRLKTKTIFAPVSFIGIYKDETSKTLLNDLFSNDNASLSVNTRKEKGFSYTISNLSFNYSNEYFIEALRKYNYGFFKTFLANYAGSLYDTSIPLYTPDSNMNIISLSDFVKAAEAVHTKYLQLPVKLPKRVRDLAASITKDCTNDYDKAKAIEKFLSSNYPYTLETKSLPRNRDFVDYFLFDQKEGYCTYYATAMAVLARCAGVPSRYVEGYMLPPEYDENGVYTVTNMNSHAWVEIYLEGFGWVSFEPTAPFLSSFYSGTIATSSETVNNSDYNETDKYRDMMEKFSPQKDITAIPADIPVPAKTDYHIITFATVAFVLIVLLVLVALLLIFIAVNNIRHRLKIIGMRELSPRESVLAAYKYYLEVLKLQKLEVMPGETSITFSKRVDNNLLFDKVKFNKVSNIFSKARYSDLEITDQEKTEVCNFYLDLLRETESNLGKPGFFILKNIFGRI